MIPKLVVTLSRTRDGQSEYMQILHGDQISVNIVLIAAEIEVQDDRPKKKSNPKKGGGVIWR